jgi:hypothetical protein
MEGTEYFCVVITEERDVMVSSEVLTGTTIYDAMGELYKPMSLYTGSTVLKSVGGIELTTSYFSHSSHSQIFQSLQHRVLRCNKQEVTTVH